MSFVKVSKRIQVVHSFLSSDLNIELHIKSAKMEFIQYPTFIKKGA